MRLVGELRDEEEIVAAERVGIVPLSFLLIGASECNGVERTGFGLSFPDGRLNAAEPERGGWGVGFLRGCGLGWHIRGWEHRAEMSDALKADGRRQ